MTRAFVSSFLVVALIAGLLAGTGVARADVKVVESTVDNGYPRELTFRLSVEADQEITDATLRYLFAGRGTSGFGRPETFTPGTSVDVEVELPVNTSSAYIPVGTTFIYHWELETASGDLITTPEQQFLFLPPDHEWRSVESDIMRVYFYGDRDDLALEYLEAGEETYQDIAVDLLQTELPVTPVNVVIFPTSEEMAPARRGRGETFDEAVRTCGTKLTVDIVFVVPLTCGTPDHTDTLRHEFGHIINEAAGVGGFGSLPAWIDEGAAVYAQTTPGSGFEGAFEAAARADRLIPFNRMGSPSNDPSLVNLFYGQSWAMVNYLIDRDGPQAFAEFFATMKRGERFDRALEEVYGFNLAGFEDEFRQSLGLEPRSRPDAEPTPDTAQDEQPEPEEEPTREPLATTGTATDSGSGIDTTVVIIVGAAVLFALLGVFFYLLSLMVSSNRQQATSAVGEGEQPWQDPSRDQDQSWYDDRP